MLRHIIKSTPVLLLVASSEKNFITVFNYFFWDTRPKFWIQILGV